MFTDDKNRLHKKAKAKVGIGRPIRVNKSFGFLKKKKKKSRKKKKKRKGLRDEAENSGE
jgi:hypothetical protein